MKKANYFFILPIILLGSMNASAQSETTNSNPQVQLLSPISLDEARENFAIANENLKKSASSSRAENAKFQNLLIESKEKLSLALESAINTEKNQEIKNELINELAKLNSNI